MNNLKKIHIIQYILLIASSVLLLITYAVTATGSDLFQWYISQHHFGAAEFPKLSMISSTILTFIIALCLLNRFQQLNYQRVLICLLLLPLLFLPISLDTYPILKGLLSALFYLAAAWCQIYTPSAIRATITGITTGMMGLIAIRSTTLEKYWYADIVRYHRMLVIISVSIFLIVWLSLKLKHLCAQKNTLVMHNESVMRLFSQYPYIFIGYILCGFNAGMFSYTYMLSMDVLPHAFVNIYQYVICAGSTILPILIGHIADQYDTFLILIFTLSILIVCKFLNAGLSFIHITSADAYYIIVFFEAGLAATIWSLSSTLIGDKLLTKSIFRSFALSAITYNIGLLICSFMYMQFAHSFVLLKTYIGLIDCVFLVIMMYFYLKHVRTHDQKKTIPPRD